MNPTPKQIGEYVFATCRDRLLQAHKFRDISLINPRLLTLDKMWVLKELEESLVVQINAQIYGEEIGDYTHKEPATWWDHFKLECAPAWLAYLWPVKYRTITLQAWALFPSYVPPRGLGEPRLYIREVE